MLRLFSVTRGDLRFQIKYGFYFIYVVMTLLYILILSLMSPDIAKGASYIMVYSDPAAMGMFFMGAIVLLEKSERVLNSIAVSPVTAVQYVLGKLLSIGFISTLVGLALLLYAGQANILLSAIGIVTASFTFTLCGIFVGTKANSLTSYIVCTLPFEIIGFVPPIAYSLGFAEDNVLMLLHPGCAQMELIMGKCTHPLITAVSLILWLVLLFLLAKRSVRKMMQSVGGVKL